jgi:hypothetical protein
MLDFRTQSQLADAAAQMMRACALAATHSWTASTLRGFSLWAELVGIPSAREARRAAFSSYRSGGGHAVAQIVYPAVDVAPAGGAGAMSALTQMQGMLGVWRAMIGASGRT